MYISLFYNDRVNVCTGSTGALLEGFYNALPHAAYWFEMTNISLEGTNGVEVGRGQFEKGAVSL